MTLRQVQLLSWLGIFVCIGIGLAGLSDRFVFTDGRVVLGTAFAGLVAVVFWRYFAERRARRFQEERDAERFQELKRHFELVGTPVEVRGSSGLGQLWVVGLITVGMLFLAWREPSIQSILVTIALLLVLGLLLLISVPSMGRPLITIYRDGIEIPACGRLEWNEIEGMGLRTHHVKGMKLYFLDVYVPGLGERQDRMHPAYRLLRRLRILRGDKRSVHVRLAGTSDSPQIVEQICRHLWTAKTGRTSRWNAYMNERAFNELKRSDQELAALEGIGKLIETDLPAANKLLEEFARRNAHREPEMEARRKELMKRHPELASTDPKEFAEGMRKLVGSNQNMEERVRELVRKRMKTHPVTWAIALALGLVMVFGLFRLAGQ